jgi:hypothetical protein
MSEVAASPALSEEKSSELSGIAGWLILPALAMIISPLRILYECYHSFLPVLKPSLWFAMLSTKSTFYNPPLALLLTWEIVANVAMFAFTIWLAFLFFKKQKSVPRLYITWLVLGIVLQIADLVFSSFVPLVVEQQNGDAYKELIKSVVAAAIWIPYFLQSKRVKNTFVNDTEIKLPGSGWD